MQYLGQVEAFVAVGFQLGAFLAITTLAVMQILKPYARSFVQKVVLSKLNDRDALKALIRSLSHENRTYVALRYPKLASTAPPFDPRRLHRFENLDGFAAQVPTGMSNELVMRVVQNAAQAAIERPMRDPIGYANLTVRADKADRVAGILIEMVGGPEFERSGGRRRSKVLSDDEGNQPSQQTIELSGIQTGLASAVERELDDLQVEMSAQWQSVGRLLAVAVGATCAAYVALSSGVVRNSAPFQLAAVAPVAFVVLGGVFSGLLNRGLRSQIFVTMMDYPSFAWLSRAIASLAPVIGLFAGLAAVRGSGEGVFSVVSLGAVAGLIASLIYDAAKAFSQRK